MPIAQHFHNELNPGQLAAATAPDGPVLVIAGAGTGKTRTIVYRLAHLVDQGVEPERILLLTFTRRAAAEMGRRAGQILARGLDSVRGGTFHSFANLVLRKNCGLLGYGDGFTLLGQSEAQDVLYHARRGLGIDMDRGKTGRSFPKNPAILSLVSAARNKEIPFSDLLDGEPHLRPYRDGLLAIERAYAERKRNLGLMDYDDLLFNLDRLLAGNTEFRERMRSYVRHVLVDEYQDTNLVQARIVNHLGGEGGNVMVVGDDAQSIYGFRGANVRNILDFPKHYPGARVIRLEQNYRSTQPVLDLANHLLLGAREGHDKRLHTERAGQAKPTLHRPEGDLDQARVVVAKVREYADTYPLHDIAVLFRAGYESFQVEIALGKAGIPFQKFGGQKFTESAHVRDAVSLLRLVANQADRAAWTRVLSMVTGVWGGRTDTLAGLVSTALATDDQEWLARTSPEVQNLLVFLQSMWQSLRPPNTVSPGALANAVIEFYSPILVVRHPEDHPVRQAALDEFAQIAQGYRTLDQLLADTESGGEGGEEPGVRDGSLVLSTVHSAKGLEWSAVLVIDLIEGCFPTRHSLASRDELEEERRLLYVACTRAKERLDLFIPRTQFNRSKQQSDPATPCPFLTGLPASVCLDRSSRPAVRQSPSFGRPSARPFTAGKPSGRSAPLPAHCSHKIFGRGRIIQFLAPDKYKVEFPQFGLKTVRADYLTLEPAALE